MSFWDKIKRKFEKSEWRLCAHHEYKYVVTYLPNHRYYKVGGNNKSDEILTYYFYEDQFGNRKIDVIDSDTGDLDIKLLRKNHFVFRSKYYRNTVRPWLDGRDDPNIPRYEQVPVNDFERKLKGK